jgi:hypothetical protein
MPLIAKIPKAAKERHKIRSVFDTFNIFFLSLKYFRNKSPFISRQAAVRVDFEPAADR